MAKVVYSRSGEFELPKNAVDWLRTHGVSEDCIEGYLLDAFPRHDPLLVQLVEKLKKDASQFFYSNLEIEEIKGNKYLIAEIDGKERVITPDTKDWIIIK